MVTDFPPPSRAPVANTNPRRLVCDKDSALGNPNAVQPHPGLISSYYENALRDSHNRLLHIGNFSWLGDNGRVWQTVAPPGLVAEDI